MFIGIDIGGTNLKVGVFDQEMKLVQRFSQSTNAEKGVDYLLNTVKRMISITIEKHKNIKAAGIGIPGIVTEEGVLKISPNLPNFRNVPLLQFFKSSVDIPVFVDNDANVAAIAESGLGAAKGYKNFIYVTMGTGIGGAIILNKRVYKGENSGAGELGYMIFDPKAELNRKIPYRTGIFEDYLGKNQVTEFARKFIEKYPESSLHKYEKPDPYFITEAANAGDKAALDLFAKLGTIFGLGLTTVFNLLDIHVAVVGGGLSAAHQVFYDTALNVIKTRALPTIASKAILRQARFTRDSGIIGAALMAKEQISEFKR